MTDLSPAAAAVLKEYELSWTADPFEMDIGALAGALRAAADQLVPAKFYNVNGGDRTVWETKRKVRDDLLVIAAELENQ